MNRTILVTLVLTSLFLDVQGALEPSALFSDHAVLLRSKDTPVFGFADPGASVKVSLGAAAATGTADAKGAWLVRLDLLNAGWEPQELKINDFTARDVLVGEVWLCSGQSNMSFKEGSADDAEEAAKARNPQIRCFVVGGGAETKPQPRISGRWLVCEPGQTLAMTAVGYQFAKSVQERVGGPVGIVESAVGAATIEAWCDPQTMAANPAAKNELDKQIAFIRDYRDYENRCDAALRAWEAKWKRSDRAAVADGTATLPTGRDGAPSPSVHMAPTAGWRPLNEKERETFGHAPGAVWFRRTWSAKDGPVFVRRRFIEKQWTFDTSSVEVYWNGKRVVRRFPADPIDKNTELYDLAAADGTLEIRVFNAAHVFDVPHTFFAGGRRLERTGWQVSEEYSMPYATPAARAEMPPPQRFCLRQHYPTGLHNGKIAGLVPMGLSGVIWYQGESNTTLIEAGSRAEAYEVLFTGFIQSWRRLFRKPDLPFAWCQLAALGDKAKNPNPTDLEWVKLRDAQQKTLKLPRTGQAILIDAGEDYDIHPRDKRTPGKRLAAWALHQVYGKTDVPYRGPHAVGTKVVNGAVEVAFADCGKGLVARDLGKRYVQASGRKQMGDVVRNSPAAQVEGFSVAGTDGVWHWADAATIAGNKVTVSAKAVPQPVAIRYGWAKNPWVNLYNAAGLPAEPFQLQVVFPGTRTFFVDATKTSGRPLSNTAQTLTCWYLSRDSFKQPAEDSELDTYKFAEWVEVMGPTGGNPTRDCFRDPQNRAVTDDYDFSRVVEGCRNIRARGLRPYLKLGNVPEKLSVSSDGGSFRMNIHPPTDFDAYGRYMAACARALVAAFGREEVARWRFAVLTEFENGGWFKDVSGDAEKTFQAYCHLYETTAAAFTREVSPDVTIGVHAMAVSEGLWDERRFIRHAAERKLPFKFVTASFYDRCPGVVAQPFDLPQTIAHLRTAAESAGLTNLFYAVDEGRLLYGRTRDRAGDHLALRIVGDTYQAAYDAHVVKQLYDCGAEYFSAWGYFSGPDDNIQGLPSVSFYVARDAAAFKGMRRAEVVTGGEVRTGVEVDAVAAVAADGKTVRVMAYAYTNELFATGTTRASFKVQLPKDWAGCEIEVERRRIDDDCNWFDEWRDERSKWNIGDELFHWSPDCPSSLSVAANRNANLQKTINEQVMPRLRASAKLHTTTERRKLGADAVFTHADDLPANSVLVLVLRN